MGNRQSSPQDGQNQQNQPESNGRNSSSNNNNNNNNSSNNGGGGAMRPSSRLQSQRDTLRSAFIPVNENQRRDERRLRRERLREQQMSGDSEETTTPGETSAALLSTVTEAMFAAAALRNAAANNNTTPTTTTTTTTAAADSPSISPFSRMIASVISEAVITSFRNGHIPTTPTQQASEQPTTQNNNNASPANNNVRQQLTMHLSPEVFQQMEPGSSENSFMRFMRLPVIVTSVSTPVNHAADNNNNTNEGSGNNTTTTTTTTGPVNADGQAPTLSAEESEVTRIIMLPVFLYGIRSSITNTTTTTAEDNDNAAAAAVDTSNDDATQPIRRRSARIRAANEARQQTRPTMNSGQWTVYIISGPNVDGIMNDNASYEELLDLASIIGPARLPTVSQEAIDTHIPVVKYDLEVKQSMVGNSEGCQICLTNYQSQDDIRILGCHHGFHDECICKWLTQGRNQCPLCRDVPVPTNG